MAWNLPPGCTDKDIDDAAPGNDPARAVQCDNCNKMFDPDYDEDCYIGWSVHGDTAQCGKCREEAKARYLRGEW